MRIRTVLTAFVALALAGACASDSGQQSQPVLVRSAVQSEEPAAPPASEPGSPPTTTAVPAETPVVDTTGSATLAAHRRRPRRPPVRPRRTTTTTTPDQPPQNPPPPPGSPPGQPPPDQPPPPPAGRRLPHSWESYTVGPDGRTLTFTYYAGVEPCSVFDSVSVVEGATQVVVTIYERDDAAPGTACIQIAKQKRASVTLSAPLGGRTVVDGSRR